MNATQSDAIKKAVSNAFRDRIDVAWEGEPEAFAAFGLVARLDVTSDVERNGGSFERRQVVDKGKLREEILQRRTALVTILLEARDPGTDPPTSALAAKLLHRSTVDFLAGEGVFLTRVSSIRGFTFTNDTREMQSGVLEIAVNYTEVYEARDELGIDWIESATVTGSVE